MTAYEPREEELTGSQFSGSDGDANRTFELTHSNAVQAGSQLIINGTIFTPTTQYTITTDGDGLSTLTIIPSLYDAMTLSISYNIEVEPAFSGTEVEKIRYSLIGENNTTMLSDSLVSLALEDAAVMQSSTDSVALRWYACYLLASNWQSLGFVTNVDGVSFKEQDAEKFLGLYQRRVYELNRSGPDKVGPFVKVSTNRDLVYDRTTSFLRTRRSYTDLG